MSEQSRKVIRHAKNVADRLYEQTELYETSVMFGCKFLNEGFCLLRLSIILVQVKVAIYLEFLTKKANTPSFTSDQKRKKWHKQELVFHYP